MHTKGITAWVIDKDERELRELAEMSTRDRAAVACHIESTAGTPFGVMLRVNDGPKANMRSWKHQDDERPCHFLARLCFDGSTVAQKKAIIYSNRSQHVYKFEDQQFAESDGTIYLATWKFGEADADSIDISRLSLTDASKVDRLADGIQDLDIKDDQRSETTPLGKIELSLIRVYLDQHRQELQELQETSLPGAHVTAQTGASDGAHRVTFEAREDNTGSRRTITSYELYNERERPFAKFTWRYGSKEVLEGLGFGERSPPPPPPPRSRLLPYEADPTLSMRYRAPDDEDDGRDHKRQRLA